MKRAEYRAVYNLIYTKFASDILDASVCDLIEVTKVGKSIPYANDSRLLKQQFFNPMDESVKHYEGQLNKHEYCTRQGTAFVNVHVVFCTLAFVSMCDCFI